jgi:hypothetical protein
LKVSVKWKISLVFYSKGPWVSKNPEISTVPGRILGIDSLKNDFNDYFSPKPSIRPS